MEPDLPLAAEGEDEVELVVVDLGVARALWEGVPTARLLARIRVDRDEDDLRAPREEGAESTWDTLVARLTGGSLAALERVKRSVARHTRAASDLGRLAASDAAVAALVHVLLSATDADASPAEGASEALPIEDGVRRACGGFDERLGRATADRRAAAFEACLQLATIATSSPMPLALLTSVLDAIGPARAVVASTAPLYPWGEAEIPRLERRACLLERADLDRALTRPERDLVLAIARAEDKLAPAPVAKIAAEVTQVLTRRGAAILFATREPRSMHSAPPVPPSSWLPSDFAAEDAALRLAEALERGATTVPRARAVIARGGEPALDAIGREMLHVERHPFASGVFAETLATAGRDRDVVRLVSYFAIAPDPSFAAAALAQCTAAELPSVLRAWLETMLTGDGAPADAETTRRLRSCIAALAPYPALEAAVKPLAEKLGG